MIPESDEQFVERMKVAARDVARTGAGDCWECGEHFRDPVAVTEEVPMFCFPCATRLTYADYMRRQVSVCECLDLAADALGIAKDPA